MVRGTDFASRGESGIVRGMKPFKAQVSDITRSTEIREILGGCELKYLLGRTEWSGTEKHDPKGMPTHQLVSYYEMGSAAHAAIEAITYGAPKEETILDAQMHLSKELDRHDDIVFTNARPDKASTVHALEEVIENWWLDAHPDSPERSVFFNAFDWPPKTEVTMLHTEAKISSQADAIFTMKPEALSNATHAIVDYKTGMSKKADSLQLWIYFWLARMTGEIPEDTEFLGYFHHVTHRQLQVADPYPGDSYIEAAIRKTHAIKESKTYLPTKGWYCKYCPFQEACPEFGAMTYGELLSMIDIEYVTS